MAVKTKRKPTKKPNTKTSKLRSFVLRHKGFSGVILVLVAGVLSVYFYQAITDYQDERTAQQYKKQLDEIDKKMAVEFDNVIKELGTPDKKSHDKICSYVSADFGQGNPSCGPWYKVSYSFSQGQDALVFTQNLRHVAESRLEVAFNNKYMSQVIEKDDIRISMYQTKNIKYKVSCSIELTLVTELENKYRASLIYLCDKVSPKPIYREVNKH